MRKTVARNTIPKVKGAKGNAMKNLIEVVETDFSKLDFERLEDFSNKVESELLGKLKDDSQHDDDASK